MAFDDVLARDPKSEEEFWALIEETFEQVEGALTAYPAETREEALAGTLRHGNFKDASLSFIRYRGVREDLDSRDYFPRARPPGPSGSRGANRKRAS